MNYLTEQANNSVSQGIRRCMAVQVAAARGHHFAWSKRDCHSGLGKASPQSKMPGSERIVPFSAARNNVCFFSKDLFLIGRSVQRSGETGDLRGGGQRRCVGHRSD